MLVPQHVPGLVLHVETDGPPLYPGGILEVHVSGLPTADFRVLEGHIELVQQEMSSLDGYRPTMNKSLASLSRIYPQFNSTVSPRKSYRQSFLTDAEISIDVPYENTVLISLPDDAPPTVKSNTAHIVWQLRASILAERSRLSQGDGGIPNKSVTRIDSETIEVVVFSPASKCPNPSLDHRPSQAAEAIFNQCTLYLESGPTQVRNGDTFTGVLRAEFRRSLPVQQVRIELIRWERSGTRQTEAVAASTVLLGHGSMITGTFYQWPFELRAPDRLVPSVATPNTFVGWHIKATLARSMRPDFHVGLMVKVYTGP